MATDLETLVLRLEANATKFESGIEKARKTFDKQAKAIEDRNKALEAKLAASNAQLAASMEKTSKATTAQIAVLGKFGGAAVLATNALQYINDEVKRLADIDDASQKIGIGAEQLQALQYAATQSASSAEEITDALRKFSLEAGQSASKSSELRKLFEANGVAMRDAKGELLPVSVLLERFGALVANAKNPMEAIAIATIGFGKAGSNLVPVLTQIGGGMKGVEQAARDARVVIDESVIQAAGKFDDAWTRAILSVKAQIANLAGEFLKLPAALDDLGILNPLALPTAAARALSGGSGSQGRINNAFSLFAGNPPLKPPGTKDTVLPPGNEATGGSRGGGGAGKTADDYAREVKQINDKIVALNIEAKTVGLSTAAQERAKTVMDLENAARDAGIKLTEKQTQEIQALATKYGQAAAAVEAARKAQQASIQSADELRSTASTALTGFISDVRQGKSAAEAFGNVLEGLASKLTELAANQLIFSLLGASGTPLGGSGGGLLSALLSGRAGGGPVNAGRAYKVGESGPEIFVPRQAGRIVKNGQGIGGVNLSMSIDARGAGPNEVQALRLEMEKNRRELPAIVRQSVANDRLRGRG